MRGQIGTETVIDRVLAEYLPYQDRQTLLDEVVEDETNALLTALLLEISGQNVLEESNEVQKTANYYAETFTVGTNGPVEGGEEIDGKRVDLGFVAESIDLRISDAVTVAFNRPGKNDHREITYTSGVSPITEIPASTRYVWLSRADSASSDPTVQMEAWE